MSDLRQSVRELAVDGGILATAVVGGVATLPTLPLTVSCAIHHISPDRPRSLISDSEVGRMSLVAGLAINACSLVTRDPRPAAFAFGVSSVLGVANTIGGRLRDFRLPPA